MFLEEVEELRWNVLLFTVSFDLEIDAADDIVYVERELLLVEIFGILLVDFVFEQLLEIRILG